MRVVDGQGRTTPRPQGLRTGCRGGAGAPGCSGSARVVLDDQLDLAGHGDLGTLRAAREHEGELLERDREVPGDGGEDVAVGAGSGDLERRHRLALRLDLDRLA